MVEKKKNVKELTDEWVAKGGVQAVFYFDVHGSSGDEVKEKMVSFVGKMTEDPYLVYAVGEVASPVDNGDKTFSTSAEVLVLAKSFDSLVNVALNYGPLSVEVLRPEKELRLSLDEAHKILGSVSNASYEFSSFVLKNVLKPEQLKEFEKSIKKREGVKKRVEGKEEEKGEYEK
ncbi:hypothetical protein HY992_02750 [Candidatus Micrarchaeota archaeon]|nr:hypothetical protein [Candidatus Micrarchaeota archaeon]